MAVVCGGIFLAASIGGPAWIALVTRWPGSKEASHQLLLDSVQSQLGRFVGPLVGGILIGAVADVIQWLSLANALSFALVALLAWFVCLPEDHPHRQPQPNRGSHSVMRVMGTIPGIGIVMVAIGTDSARTFLPRFMQIDGQGEVYYAWTVSTLSLLAAIGAFVIARIRPTHRRMDR